MDEISGLIERAIAVAELVRKNDPTRFQQALIYIEETATELRVSSPEHPALKRLDEYLKLHRAGA